MGEYFGVHSTPKGIYAAQYRNGRLSWILRDGTPAELKANMNADTQILLTDSAGRSLRDRQKLLDSWKNSGIPVSRVLDPHTALAIHYAFKQRFRAEELVAVVECDGLVSQITLVELTGDMIEELAFCRYQESDPVVALRQALSSIERTLEDLPTALILDSEEETGQIRYVLRPGAYVGHYTGPDVAIGAAIYGAVLQGELSDLMVLRCTPYALGIKPEYGGYTRVLPAGTTYPCREGGEVFASRKGSLEFSLVEEREERIILGIYRVSNIPYDAENVTIELSIGSDGNLTIYASPDLDPKKHLPLSVVAAAPADPAKTASGKEDGALAAVRALLPVYDNLYLAVSQPCSDPAYKRGIEQILKGVIKQLSDLGAEPYGAVGEQFDPKLHNAVLHLPDYNLGEKEISRVFHRGIRMNGKVLRVADVQVAN